MISIVKALKAVLGLVYTTLIMFACEFGILLLTYKVVQIHWTILGVLAFIFIGLPIIVGIFQLLATLLSIPVSYLLKGSRYISLVLLLPALYFSFSFGRVLWMIASAIGGISIWIFMVAWFFEFVWLFGAYVMIALSSAFESEY